MPAVTVRVASAADAPAVARLMTALNEAVGPVFGLDRTPENVTVTEEQARRRIERMAGVDQVLLAEAAGESIGLLSLRTVPYLDEDVPYAEITELFVLAEQRDRGVARRLIDEAETVAHARGCTSIHVNAWHDNAEAQSTYRSAGYAPVEIGFEKRLHPSD
jgi:ribosomal protein S18 acetylase RimI-like enzyme